MSSTMKPLVTPSSFHICSLMTVVPKARQVGTDSMDAMTLPDPVSVEALRAALAEAAERHGLRKPRTAQAAEALPIIVPRAAASGAKASRRTLWTRVALALGVFLLLGTTRFAADRLDDDKQADPTQDVAAATPTVEAAQAPPAVTVEAPAVTVPVVVTATAAKEKPAVTVARRPAAVPAATTPPPAKRAPARTKEDDDLEAAARLQRLAAQQVGATLGR